jgi:hypothetical protein
LVSRPLSLELLESGLVIDRGSRSEMVNVDVHDGVHQSAPKRGSTLGQVYKG